MLHFSLLGRYDVRLNDEPLVLSLRPVQLLLAYLLLNREKKLRREQLAGILWPDYTETSARKNLRNSVYRLRKAIGDDYLVADRGSVAFNTEAAFWLDVAQLEEATAAEEIESLIQAVGLYQGELLPGFYEDWILRERERFQSVFDRQMQGLLERLNAAGRWSESLTWAEHWISQGRAPEPAYRTLMQAHAALGDQASMAQAYQRVRQALEEALGVPLAAETERLYQELLAGDTKALPTALDRLGGNVDNIAMVGDRLGRSGNITSIELPTGTITFLFTDVEASTQLFEQAPERAQVAIARHEEIIERNAAVFDGVVVKSRGEGDSHFIVFVQAKAAAAAAVLIQQDLFAESWETPRPLKVRIALHTGEATLRQGDYYGTDVNRCARLRGIGHGGQILLSGATWTLVQDDLPPGVTGQDEGEHRLKDLSRPEHVYQLIIPDLPHDFPPLRSLSIIPNNLPVQLTEFIGRQEATMETRRTLQECRLLTIVGPGGIGKSRLAIEMAADLAKQFRHGVFFVPLAPLTDDQYIVVTISDIIGLRNPAGSDLRQGLLNYLRHKQLLLIMDNFEHVLASADIVTDILHEAPQVKVICTSRERLNLSSEAVYMLSGLDYPTDPRLTGEEVARFGAVQLLLDRARLVRPGLEVDGLELAQAARICRLVQGMPLALVLAAGWLEMLTFEEVADEITASLDILEGRARDMPERQRSVRAAFDYSWGRLTIEDQQAYSQLSVFRGGFSRWAAQQVAGAGLRTLRTLVEKSLITADGADRFAVHELLRQFAEEKLDSAGQGESIRDAHSHYYLEAVAQREADLKGRRQLEALEEIEVDLDNVRAAWAWSIEQQDERAIDRAQEGISLFFFMRSRNQEGWSLFQQALQGLMVDQPQNDYSRHLWGRLTARAGLLQAQFVKSAPEIEEEIKKSLAIAEANADGTEIAYAYLALGHYHSRVTRDFPQALDYFLQALERYQSLGELYFVAHLLHRVGYSHAFAAGGLEEYMRYTRQSLELARQIGDLFDEAMALGNLGWGSLDSGDYAEAEGYAREANALSRQVGDRLALAHSLVHLGLCQVLFGRLEEAQEAASEGVKIAEDVVFTLTQAFGLAVMSVRASLDGDYELGRDLAGESLDRHTNPSGDFLGHWAQAMAFVGMGKMEQAWRQSLTALEICVRWSWDARATWMLPVLGIIRARQGQPERASEMLGLYFNHPMRPTGWAEKWPLLSEWQARLQENLGANSYQAAWERGRDLVLMKVVEALLAEGK